MRMKGYIYANVGGLPNRDNEVEVGKDDLQFALIDTLRFRCQSLQGPTYHTHTHALWFLLSSPSLCLFLSHLHLNSYTAHTHLFSLIQYRTL